MKKLISYLHFKVGISGAAILFFFIFFIPRFYYSQCMSYPISIEERIAHSQMIVLGKLVQKHSYWDSEKKNIYTLNVINISSYFKGNNGDTQIGIITEGGVVGNKAQITHPSLEVDDYNEYIFFLQADNFQKCDYEFRAAHPNMKQVETYASAQGAITKQFGKYHDTYSEPVHTEASIFKRISDITKEKVTSPNGKDFAIRADEKTGQNKTMMPITSIVPNITRAGTIDPLDFVTITGTGFGAAPGNVFYSNADDGGATLVNSGVASDYITWAAGGTSINAKPARRAGTGPYQVNAIVSPAALTVNFSHIEINSNFNAFPVTTRQRYYLVNKNALGGYSFTYNSTFFTNAPAVAAFGRALDTWRCATFVNFRTNAATTGIAAAALDGVCCVYFEPGLPAGVLGVCTSYFSGSATGACNLANTVWWLDEMDVQFKTNPPVPGFTWNFGPAASTGTQYDMESVALHETGHGHGLGHIINFGQVMHYAIANGSDIRTLSVNEIGGGNAKMAYSTIPLCFIPATVTGPMIPYPPCNLAIQLVSFTGNCLNNKTKLNWTTATETKNNFFTLEGSDDGINFEVIAKVKGAGDSKQYLNYAFEVDANANKNYYRLKQTDFDGRSEYINAISVSCNINSPEILIYPNPNNGIFTIKGADLNSEILITNPMGEKVLVTKANSVSTEINLSFLAKGMYFINILPNISVLKRGESSNGINFTRKLIIQ